MTTKRQQAMLAAKSAPKVKKTAELSFEAFYDKNEAALEQLYELNLDALKACGDVTEKKRSFDDFVDWAYSLYTKFEIVDDDDEDEDDEDEVDDDDDEDEEGDADDELTETESEDDIEVTLGSDDPSSFDGESVDESDDEDDEDDEEDVEPEESKE